jgi:hypothetical protein
MKILLEDFHGEEVAALPATRLLNSFLPDLDDEAFTLLGYVDVEGETIFHHAQAPALFADLNQLKSRLPYEDGVAFVEEIMGLVVQLANDPTLRLRFSGA